jgi:hypothetical protein
MTLSSEKREILIELLRSLMPGQISTLGLSLSERDSQIGTSTDSKNYAFLQKLSEWGFAREVPLEVDMPPEIQVKLTSFAINEDVKEGIAKLLREMSA